MPQSMRGPRVQKYVRGKYSLHGSNTMRIAIFALAVLAGGGAAEAGQIELLSGSPRHFEIAARCWTGSNCQQEASDFAQGYCRGQFEVPRRALCADGARRAQLF